MSIDRQALRRAIESARAAPVLTAHQALERCHQDPGILASPVALLALLQELAASQYAAGILRGREIATEREDE